MWVLCYSGTLAIQTTHLPKIANMQVITAIYLNCRPDLRDEWLTGIEIDDAADAQVRGVHTTHNPQIT